MFKSWKDSTTSNRPEPKIEKPISHLYQYRTIGTYRTLFQRWFGVSSVKVHSFPWRSIRNHEFLYHEKVETCHEGASQEEVVGGERFVTTTFHHKRQRSRQNQQQQQQTVTI